MQTEKHELILFSEVFMLLLQIASFLIVAYFAVKVGLLLVSVFFSWLFTRDAKAVEPIETIPQYSYSDSAYGGVVKNW